MKERSDKLDFINIKNFCFCSAKDNVKRMITQARDWQKIFAIDISDEELLPQEVKYKMTEGNLTLSGKHTMQYSYNALLDCILEIYVILLTNDTLINLIKKNPLSKIYKGLKIQE